MMQAEVRGRHDRGGFTHRLLGALTLMLMMAGSGLAQQPAPPSGKQWNHIETDNFVVLAINPEHRDYLGRSLEFMRRWEFDRWGMKQVNFSVKCTVLVASSRDEFKQLFNGKDTPQVRIDRNASGRITAMSIWCWADPKWHASVLPRLLTEVCLSEFEQQYNVRFPLWLHRGMGVLNGSLPEISQNMADLGQIYAQNLPCFWTEDLLNMTTEKLGKYQPQNQQWFDKESAALCLYMIKTHGQKKFLDFLDTSLKAPASAPPVLGFATYAEFDTAFNRYMYNLTQDVKSGRTQSSYLTWDAK